MVLFKHSNWVKLQNWHSNTAFDQLFPPVLNDSRPWHNLIWNFLTKTWSNLTIDNWVKLTYFWTLFIDICQTFGSTYKACTCFTGFNCIEFHTSCRITLQTAHADKMATSFICSVNFASAKILVLLGNSPLWEQWTLKCVNTIKSWPY